MSEVCLFLDINHCQKVLKEPLLKRLSTNIFSAFTDNSGVLKTIARAAFQDREETVPHLQDILNIID